MELSFKRFLEATEKKPGFVSTVGDELGIDPSSFEKVPQWAGNVTLGNVSYNGIMYKVTQLVRKNGEVTGAMVRPMNIEGVKTQRAYLKGDDGMMRRPDSSVSSAEQFIPIDLLNKLMTQGMGTGGAPMGGM